MIRVDGLTTRYSKRDPEVLRGVSLSLGKGQIGVLMGPNGSGKSTLLRCFLGLMKYEGHVCFDEQDIAALSPKKRARLFSYVPQAYVFPPSMVFDAVMMGRVSRFIFAPGAEDERAVIEALEEVGMAEYAARNVAELSGGERQKVAVARALAQEAEAILLDEPTSNLDIAAEANLLRLVRELAEKRGLSLLMAVHDINLAYSLGDRFFFLKEGRIAYDVPRDEMNASMLSDVFGVSIQQIDFEGKPYFVYERSEI
ncbi:MAG: ABC transporter ATP-binding protein [Bacilli bacterium]|nr:ABC transporter ATP-binding protein [Bacilli bacterium]